MRAVFAREIEALFEGEVIVETGVPDEVEGELWPGEELLVARAIGKRRREFTAGRVLARRALARLGAPAGAILTDGRRAPLWPAGFVGSISHTRGFCAVAASAASAPRAPDDPQARTDDGETANRVRIRSLGLDVEAAADLGDELVPRICTAGERAWLARQPADRRGRLGKLVFSAKEAFYKCQHPLTGRFLEFDDVELELELGDEREGLRGAFVARVSPDKDELPRDARFVGRFIVTHDLVVAASQALDDTRSSPAPHRSKP